MLGSEMLELTPGARAKLDALFAQLASVHDRENGNGRAVRNLLECAKRCQAMRLPYISRASPLLYLLQISRTSRLNLAYISPTSRRRCA